MMHILFFELSLNTQYWFSDDMEVVEDECMEDR